jgi:hypothetical protein
VKPVRLRSSAILVAAASALLAAAPAGAHVQVQPAAAAPGDAVLFSVLVPNEREQSTVQVSLKVPKGVLPFAYEDPPGWRRKVTLAGDGSTDVVRWSGRLRADGFVRFGILAGTPEREGDLKWSAIQKYSDGKEAAWIGPPDAEEPAPVTRISSDVPRANAGGESEGGGGGEATPAPTAAATATPHAEESGDDGGSSNAPGIILGGAGLVLGAAALVVALRRRERPEGQPASVES